MPTALEKTPARSELRSHRLPTIDEMFNGMVTEFERFWESPFGMLGRALPRTIRGEMTKFEWVPRVDVTREGNELVVDVDLPGMKKDDIELTVDKDALVLTGERKHEKRVEEKDYWRCERTYGNFYRRIPLGFEIDPKSVKANFRNGVLELHLPVPEKALPEPKPIAIS